MAYEERCKTCYYFDGKFCHRYPPQTSTDSGEPWPIVEEMDWCGEWKLNPGEENA